MTIVLAAFPAVGSATFIPGPNGKIAFASGRANAEFPAPAANDDAKARIWVVDWPFGTPVQVTTKPEGVTQHRHPNWSPDHSKIVYAAGPAFAGPYALWIADLKTGTQKEFVAAHPMQDRPTWSPDGTRIAFGSEGDLYVKDVAEAGTGKGAQITNTAGFIEERAVWSPDGNTLYYNRKTTAMGAKRDLYKKSPVTLAGAEESVLSTAEDEWQPSLSPDGKRLCYLQGEQNDTAKLRTVNVTGLGDSPFIGDGATGALNCVWAPDGTRILYTEGAFGAGELRSRNVNAGDFLSHSGFNVASHFDGNADWATNFPPTCGDRSTSVGVNGFVPIVLTCTDPDFGFGKAPPTPTPIEDNGLELATQPTHGTLGGLSDGKVIYTPGQGLQGHGLVHLHGRRRRLDLGPGDGHDPNRGRLWRRRRGRHDGADDLQAEGLRQALAAGSRAGEHLEVPGGDDDLLQAQRGGGDHPRLPAGKAGPPGRPILRQADRGEQGQARLHPLRRRRLAFRAGRQGRHQQGALPGSPEPLSQARPRCLPSRRPRPRRGGQQLQGRQRPDVQDRRELVVSPNPKGPRCRSSRPA